MDTGVPPGWTDACSTPSLPGERPNCLQAYSLYHEFSERCSAPAQLRLFVRRGSFRRSLLDLPLDRHGAAAETAERCVPVGDLGPEAASRRVEGEAEAEQKGAGR